MPVTNMEEEVGTLKRDSGTHTEESSTDLKTVAVIRATLRDNGTIEVKLKNGHLIPDGMMDQLLVTTHTEIRMAKAKYLQEHLDSIRRENA